MGSHSTIVDGQLMAGYMKVSSTITQSYDYYAWNTSNGWGRLVQITSGSIQDLDYTYDANGNITQIKDSKATGSTQYQSFEYDAMNRLVDAEVTGGTGGIYSEEYQYDSSTGNLKKKTWGSDLYTYTYDTTHLHAVASATYGSTTWSYDYDANGNMDSRSDGSTTTTLDYDVENRLVSTSNPSATFVYDGNGVRVKGTIGGTTTVYIGNYYEWTGSTSTMKSYYYAGGTRIAVRDGTGTGTNGLSWLFADHLGSTSLTTNASGTKTAEVRYKAWGEDRYTWGTTPTTMKYTGQREESLLGLHFYNARWYDPALGRFIQADSIIPELGNPMAWDRYAYAINNPLYYTDPSGHASESPVMDAVCQEEYCNTKPKQALADYGVKFNKFWRPNYIMYVLDAVVNLGMRFASIIGGTGAEAFRSVYGHITFSFNPGKVSGALGWAENDHSIVFGGFLTDAHASTRLVTHELGHVFDRAVCAANSGSSACDNVWAEGSARSDLEGRMMACTDSTKCLGRKGYTNPKGEF